MSPFPPMAQTISQSCLNPLALLLRTTSACFSSNSPKSRARRESRGGQGTSSWSL